MFYVLISTCITIQRNAILDELPEVSQTSECILVTIPAWSCHNFMPSSLSGPVEGFGMLHPEVLLYHHPELQFSAVQGMHQGGPGLRPWQPNDEEVGAPCEIITCHLVPGACT